MPESAPTALPFALPSNTQQRLALKCLRRMAAHGLRDAGAAMMVFDHFGIRFRRPLVLLRAFVADLARVSQRTITLAPCCAHRMTRDEARLLDAMFNAADNPGYAREQLRHLTQSTSVESPLSIAQALIAPMAGPGRQWLL